MACMTTDKHLSIATTDAGFFIKIRNANGSSSSYLAHTLDEVKTGLDRYFA